MPNCLICGQPMVHYRETGYRCFQERHNEMAREIEARIIDDYTNGKLTDEQWEAYMRGDVPEGYLK